MSLSVPERTVDSMTALRYFDVIVIVVAAPIMLLIGVPAAGYLIGAGAWLALRAAAIGVEQAATATPDASRQIAIRMAFMMSRLFLLALAVILARHTSQNDGLTALVVVVFGFTIGLAMTAATRPRSR